MSKHVDVKDANIFQKIFEEVSNNAIGSLVQCLKKIGFGIQKWSDFGMFQSLEVKKHDKNPRFIYLVLNA